jgi:hypothetical protein
MARTNVAPPAGLDHKALAGGLGRLKTGGGGVRLVGKDGATLAYLKKRRITVPASLVTKAPRGLGAFQLESNGRWAGVAVADTAAARRVVEYVAGQMEKAGHTKRKDAA